MILALTASASSSLAMARLSSSVLRRAVPHVRLEERVAARGHPLLGDLQQRADVAVELVLGAVVGVQRDRDRVLLGDDVRELGEGDRAGHHLLLVLAAQELRATRGDLDDAVALRLGEAAQRGVQRLGRRDVDGRVGELACLRPVQHLAVDLGGCDGHRFRSSCSAGVTAGVATSSSPSSSQTRTDTPPRCTQGARGPPQCSTWNTAEAEEPQLTAVGGGPCTGCPRPGPPTPGPGRPASTRPGTAGSPRRSSAPRRGPR